MSSIKQSPISLLHITKAKTRSAAKQNSDKKDDIHQYKVGYVPNGGKRAPSPAINLGGRWLADFGFITGQGITVSAQQGLLMIKADGLSLETEQV